MNFTENLVNIQHDLFRFAAKLTANENDARDLLQETSLKVLDNENKFTPDTNFKGWAFTIMRNLFINDYRKVVREQTYVDQTDNQHYLNKSENYAVDMIESVCDVKEMYHIINKLSNEYRQPFLMFVAGYKYHEIGNKLNLPLGTVKSRIFFARQQLKNELKDFN
jgi:RNA polymerase sigma-70 factor (ECF subfamily)